MGCRNNCYPGSNFALRNVKNKGAMTHVEAVAQQFADLNQEDVIIFERNVHGKGIFYDFEPKGRKKYKKLLKFNKKNPSKDILSNSKGKGPKSPQSKKTPDKAPDTK